MFYKGLLGLALPADPFGREAAASQSASQPGAYLRPCTSFCPAQEILHCSSYPTALYGR